MDFKTRLYHLRKSRNLKQADLAALFEKNKDFISKLENGHTNPGLDVLIVLAAHFNVSVDYLVGVSNDPIVEHKLATPSLLQIFSLLNDLYTAYHLNDDDTTELIPILSNTIELYRKRSNYLEPSSPELKFIKDYEQLDNEKRELVQLLIKTWTNEEEVTTD